MLQYELARRRLEVGEKLMRHAPRPVIVQSIGGGEQQSALSILLLARLLPQIAADNEGDSGSSLPGLPNPNDES